MRIMILNGPNLNMLGIREPHIYGSTTLDAIKQACEEFAAFAGAELAFHQSNHEGELIDWVQEAARGGHPVVLNGAGWTHTSVAMRDACALLPAPLVEVHISNVHAREEFRRHSYVSAVAAGVIVGLGVTGYALAIRWLAEHAAEAARTPQ